MGVYVATGHRSETLASLPWPLVFFGLIAAATAGYLALAQVVALAARISFRQAVSTFGYIFLPLGFSTAILTFGADSFEFFGVGQPTASLLLAVGFVWSAVIAVSIVRNACQGPRPAASCGCTGCRGVACCALPLVVLVCVRYGRRPDVDVLQANRLSVIIRPANT